MQISKQILLSNFLNHTVLSDEGLDHGPGIMAWMHPPVHRVLGWISRPSSLKLVRDVWRLDQLKGIGLNHIYVKGIPALSDQATLNRFPTLLEADLLNKDGIRIGTIADLVFCPKSGKIIHYLVSRSNPKIPGTSRWCLKLEYINDQQPGMILSSLSSLDDLILLKASLRQGFLQKSKGFRSQIEDFTVRASNKLEGWLEESPWDDNFKSVSPSLNNLNDSWVDEEEESLNEYSYDYEDIDTQKIKNDKDPWI